MIRKLRTKLLLVSMLSLFLVLSIMLGSVCALVYRVIVSTADDTLTILVQNDGALPGEADGQQKARNSISESRYFLVSLRDGVPEDADTGHISSVDEDAAFSYAEKALHRNRTQGFVEIYRYVVVRSPQGEKIIFLDCGSALQMFRIFVSICVIVSSVVMGAVFLLMSLLSRRIVKPFSETYEKQRRFITDAGHELKTPLSIIDADAEVLELDLGENEWLTDIQSQTRRLAQLTNNLIFLARLEEDQPKLQSIEFSLSDLAEDTLSGFQALAITQHKTLDSQIQPMLAMVGDETALRRLLVILLDNAMKYSEEGGRISLTLSRKKNSLVLQVFNTTPSISQEHLPHLFDRFYRTDQSRNSQTGGYGLGLSIAAAITAAHKGKISASAEDGKSLLITAVFPAV